MRPKRKVSAVTTCRKEYKIVTNYKFCEPYWDEGWTYYKKGRKYTTIFQYEYRNFRTWKHNRKTQWK